MLDTHIRTMGALPEDALYALMSVAGFAPNVRKIVKAMQNSQLGSDLRIRDETTQNAALTKIFSDRDPKSDSDQSVQPNGLCTARRLMPKIAQTRAIYNFRTRAGDTSDTFYSF